MHDHTLLEVRECDAASDCMHACEADPLAMLDIIRRKAVSHVKVMLSVQSEVVMVTVSNGKKKTFLEQSVTKFKQ